MSRVLTAQPCQPLMCARVRAVVAMAANPLAARECKPTKNPHTCVCVAPKHARTHPIGFISVCDGARALEQRLRAHDRLISKRRGGG